MDISGASEPEGNSALEQLNMYKALNRDLAVRIQELKVELTAKTNELNQSRVEFFDEKALNARLRHYLGILNQENSNYLNNCLTTLQQMADEGIVISRETNFNTTRGQNGNRSHAARVSSSYQSIQSRLQRVFQNTKADDGENNLLNTIKEESCTSECIVTSTPLSSGATFRNFVAQNYRQSLTTLSAVSEDINNNFSILLKAGQNGEESEQEFASLTENKQNWEHSDSCNESEYDDDDEQTIRPSQEDVYMEQDEDHQVGTESEQEFANLTENETIDHERETRQYNDDDEQTIRPSQEDVDMEQDEEHQVEAESHALEQPDSNENETIDHERETSESEDDDDQNVQERAINQNEEYSEVERKRYNRVMAHMKCFVHVGVRCDDPGFLLPEDVKKVNGKSTVQEDEGEFHEIEEEKSTVDLSSRLARKRKKRNAKPRSGTLKEKPLNVKMRRS